MSGKFAIMRRLCFIKEKQRDCKKIIVWIEAATEGYGKKDVPKDSSKFIGKHRLFLVNFAKFLRISFFKEHLR